VARIVVELEAALERGGSATSQLDALLACFAS
jgi:hypothetical protein